MSQEGAIQAVKGEKQGSSVNHIGLVQTSYMSAISTSVLGMHGVTDTQRQTEGGDQRAAWKSAGQLG